VVTYSLLDGAELLELLAKSILIGVPGKASVGVLVREIKVNW
jgi:hypothetical protein